ncbi:MAG: hypothetical protein R3B46_08295 [Phycisphaerales bacterium]
MATIWAICCSMSRTRWSIAAIDLLSSPSSAFSGDAAETGLGGSGARLHLDPLRRDRGPGDECLAVVGVVLPRHEDAERAASNAR